MRTETKTTRQVRNADRIGAPGARGGCFMTSVSVGSKASAMPSVTAVIMLIHRICTGVIGRVWPRSTAVAMIKASPPLVGKQKQNALLQVFVDRAAFFDGVGDGCEIVVREHDLGRLLGGLGALAPHGDADIGALERGRVVDPVAGHGDDFAVCLQCLDQAQFMLGRRAGEDVRLVRHGNEFILGKPVELLARHGGVIAGEPELGSDRGSRRGMIAGDHLDPDSRLAAERDGLDGVRARQVDQAEQSEQRQTAFGVLEAQVPVVGRRRTSGDREHALGLRRHLFRSGKPVGAVERNIAVPGVLAPAHLQDALGRAFDVDAAMSGMVVMQRCHELVLGLKGDQVRARPGLPLEPGIELGLQAEGHQGAIRRIALQLPFAVFLAEFGVVAQKGGAGDRHEIGIIGDGNRLVGNVEIANGSIAGAGYGVGPRGGHERLHHQLVSCQRVPSCRCR